MQTGNNNRNEFGNTRNKYMQIVFNGNNVTLDHDMSLKDFLEEKGVSIEGSAAACDEEIVPKAQWGTFVLKDGMQIDVFSLVAGG